MISRIRGWWEHLGYSWNKRRGEFRTFGLRPWRGAPFFWFIVDHSHTATQSKTHVASCEDCDAKNVPTPDMHCPDTPTPESPPFTPPGLAELEARGFERINGSETPTGDADGSE